MVTWHTKYGQISHKGQNFVQRTTFKVMRSRKKVCRLSLRTKGVVAQGKPAIIVNKTRQVQFTQSNFFTNKTLSNLILFGCFACEACNSVKLFLRSMKDVLTTVQTSSNNLSKPKLLFPPRKLNVSTKFTLALFSTPIRWPVMLIRRPEAKRRN